MHLTRYQACGDVEGGELVLEIDLPDALLEATDLHHRLVHVNQVFPGNVHGYDLLSPGEPGSSDRLERLRTVLLPNER
jgi:hypothetical protein